MDPGKPTITADVYIISTTYEYTTPDSNTFAVGTAASSTSISDPSPHGYDTTDKIALGVGLGIGIPTLIATVWMCCLVHIRG